MSIRTENGGSVRVGPALAQPRGEGTVYRASIAGRRGDVAFKRYHDRTLANPRYRRQRDKITALIAQTPTIWREPGGHVVLPWPMEVVLDGGRFVGFLMPLADLGDTVELHNVVDMSERTAARADTPGWLRGFTWRYHVVVALNLASALRGVHAAGAVFGDMNAGNVLVHSTARVTLVDCDGVQIRDVHGALHPSAVVLPDTAAPEFRTGVENAPAADLYTLAFHIHQLLLLGERPHSGVWRGSGPAPDLAERKRGGDWVYGAGRFAPRPAAPPISILPPSIVRLFRRAFVDGARNPSERPSAQEWVAELNTLSQQLTSCSAAPDRHVYWQKAPKRNGVGCPWCARDQASAQQARPAAIPSPKPQPVPKPSPKPPAAAQIPTAGASAPPHVTAARAAARRRSVVGGGRWTLFFALVGWVLMSLLGALIGSDRDFSPQPGDLFPALAVPWAIAWATMAAATAAHTVIAVRLGSEVTLVGEVGFASERLRRRFAAVAVLCGATAAVLAGRAGQLVGPEDWWPVIAAGACGWSGALTVHLGLNALALRSSGRPRLHAPGTALLVVAVVVAGAMFAGRGVALADQRATWEGISADMDTTTDDPSICRPLQFDAADSVRNVASGGVLCRRAGGAVTGRFLAARSDGALERIVEMYVRNTGQGKCSAGRSGTGTWRQGDDGADLGDIYCWSIAGYSRIAWTENATRMFGGLYANGPRELRGLYRMWKLTSLPSP